LERGSKTDLSHNFGGNILDFAELESREGNGEIGALFTIVYARIHLVHSKRRERSGHALGNFIPERVKSTCGWVGRRLGHLELEFSAERGGKEPGWSTSK
jgi:hypothetical protein